MAGRDGLVVAIALGVAGCAGPLAGRWRGDLDCGGGELELALELEGEGSVQAGLGSRTEARTDGEQGTDVDIIERFEITLALTEGLAAQELVAELDCTEIETVSWKVGRVDPSSQTETCDGEPFAGYTVTWDGRDVLTFAGPDGCAGDVERLGR